MAAGKSRGVRGRRAASRRMTEMAVPLPHAPPSSGMHPRAAPCTQRRLGAETPWSRKPKACGPPTMALAPLTPPLPPECSSAHSQADSGLRYWSWDSSKRLHQILRTPVPACRAAHAVPGSNWPQWGHLLSPFSPSASGHQDATASAPHPSCGGRGSPTAVHSHPPGHLLVELEVEGEG